jgi:hypothetical protein
MSTSRHGAKRGRSCKKQDLTPVKYHGSDVKTLLVSSVSVPAELRDILERGSTSLDSLHGGDATALAIARLAPDRIVFWHVPGDDDLEKLANAIARSDPGEATTSIVFVSAGAAGTGQWLAPDQMFIWPTDEDRLRMAFMTGG